MIKHPGIVFTIWSFVVMFLVAFEFALLDTKPWISGSIMFFIFSMCGFWVTYYHACWIEKLVRKGK